MAMIESPAPKPERGGPWGLVRGIHWLLVNAYGEMNPHWTSLPDAKIRLLISERNHYTIGLINEQQRGLYESIYFIPYESLSRLQRDVYAFVNSLSDTNHPLARWSNATYRICQDIRRVHSPYDLIGYQFFHLLATLHDSINPNKKYDYMLSCVADIFCEPGRYAALVDEFYPNWYGNSEDDPFGITSLDEDHLFKLVDRMPLGLEAVMHYLWVVLKIPRSAARFNLEPFMQLATSIRNAVRTLQELHTPEDLDAPPMSRLSSMTWPQAIAGRGFHIPQSVEFECGPFPLEDPLSGAVNWVIPPTHMQNAVTTIEINFGFVPEHLREEFGPLFCKRQAAPKESLPI